MIPFGIRLYGLGAIALGLVGLVWGDFALQWQPVAAWVPGRTVLAYSFSGALVITGAAINGVTTNGTSSTSAFGAAALTGLYGLVVIFMHGPQILLHPASFVAWDGAAEQLALFAGGLAAYSYLTRTGAGAAARTGAGPLAAGPAVGSAARPETVAASPPSSSNSHRLGQAATVTMGVCLLMFGTAHFLYLDFTASMVPAWLPGGRKFWAVATGVGHLAAGVALITGIKARLAAIAVTVMFGIFSVLVHLPLLLADPRAHLGWVMNAINLALTGAAWASAMQLAGERHPVTAPASSQAASPPAADPAPLPSIAGDTPPTPPTGPSAQTRAVVPH